MGQNGGMDVLGVFGFHLQIVSKMDFPGTRETVGVNHQLQEAFCCRIEQMVSYLQHYSSIQQNMYVTSCISVSFNRGISLRAPWNLELFDV